MSGCCPKVKNHWYKCLKNMKVLTMLLLKNHTFLNVFCAATLSWEKCHSDSTYSGSWWKSNYNQ